MKMKIWFNTIRKTKISEGYLVRET